jgi:hypothetical protein
MKKRQFLAPLVVSLGALLGTLGTDQKTMASNSTMSGNTLLPPNGINQPLQGQTELHEFVITRDENNRLFAKHRSHYSHSSHTSHSSHYSSHMS